MQGMHLFNWLHHYYLVADEFSIRRRPWNAVDVCVGAYMDVVWNQLRRIAKQAINYTNYISLLN